MQKKSVIDCPAFTHVLKTAQYCHSTAQLIAIVNDVEE